MQVQIFNPARLSSTLATMMLPLLIMGCANKQAQDIRPSETIKQSENRLFVGPVFLTGDDEIPEAKAIVVNPAGQIITLMKEMPASTKLEIVRLNGKFALPGLHDAHMHLRGLGQQSDLVNLKGATSVEDVVNRIAQWYSKHPHANMILGRGWDQNRFRNNQMPSSDDLSGLPKIPIVLTRVDGHAIWVNDAAMKLAGETSAPEASTAAAQTITQPGIYIDHDMARIRQVLPDPSSEMVQGWLSRGLDECARNGLVAVHDMGMSVKSYLSLLALAADHPLPVRVFVYLDAMDPDTNQILEQRLEAPRVHLMGVKLMADGAMGSRGAALHGAYEDAPGHHGTLLIDGKILEETIRDVHSKGFQVAIHAIGDKANQLAIESVAAAQGSDSSRRHRIEHVQLISNDDLKAFQTLHLIASMQPTHATSDMYWVEDRIGKQRIQNAYAWRTLINAGAHLAFGSDAPVESIDPRAGIFAAISRTDIKGQPPGGWYPDQKLFVNEAIDGFSSGAAYAVHQETNRGSLKAGYQFDLTLLDIDPRAEHELWLKSQVRGTWIDGHQIMR